MEVSYFVRYEGRAQSQAAFLDYYRQGHVPVLARLPGILKIVLHTPVAWRDPFPVQPDRFALIAQMIFAGPEELEAALQSDARALARDDFANFPPFAGAVYHQAAASDEVFAR